MAADGSGCAHSAAVTEVKVDGERVGDVFGAAGTFWFVLDDERDRARGPFEFFEAVQMCEQQARCIRIADMMELMLDT